MSKWQISDLELGTGRLGIAPIPGRFGDYEGDLSTLLIWAPDLVLTMTTEPEMERVGAAALGADLGAIGIAWRHLPIFDFGSPEDATAALWPEASQTAHAILAAGGRVLAHCFGGCGRSGMALLRLMVEAGEDVDPGLERLRKARPCAVEVDAQMAWAARPMFERNGWTP